MIVGTATVESGRRRVESHFGDIGNVWVHSHSRRLGIATLAMEAIIEWGRQHPILEKLGLFVFSSSPDAIGLYEKVGFEIEGQAFGDMKFGPNDYVDTVVMGMWVKQRP